MNKILKENLKYRYISKKMVQKSLAKLKKKIDEKNRILTAIEPEHIAQGSAWLTIYQLLKLPGFPFKIFIMLILYANIYIIIE
jgi:hypothetical protein